MNLDTPRTLPLKRLGVDIAGQGQPGRQSPRRVGVGGLRAVDFKFGRRIHGQGESG